MERKKGKKEERERDSHTIERERERERRREKKMEKRRGKYMIANLCSLKGLRIGHIIYDDCRGSAAEQTITINAHINTTRSQTIHS